MSRYGKNIFSCHPHTATSISSSLHRLIATLKLISLRVSHMAFKMGLWANIWPLSLRQRLFCWCPGFSAGRAPSWLQVFDSIRGTGQCCQVSQPLYGNMLIIPIGPVLIASVIGRAAVLAGFLLFLTITLAKCPVMTPLYPPGLQSL